MSEDNVHERINKLDTRVTRIEATQPMLQELMERSITTNEKLGETLHEMQTSMALMNSKIDAQIETFDNRMDAQAEAFDELKQDMEKAGKKTEASLEKMNNRVASIEEKGKFDIFGYIKTKLPWIIILISAGAMALSDKIKI